MRRNRPKAPPPYRSMFEFTISQHMIKEDIKFEYEAYTLTWEKQAYRHECLDCGSTAVVKKGVYLLDWYLPDHKLHIESKGLLSAPERKKLKSIYDQHPDIDFRIMLMYNRKMKSSKWDRYGDWCDWASIPWCEGTEIPKDWLE